MAEFMEKDNDEWDTSLRSDQERVQKVLGKYGLCYMKGGFLAVLGETKISKTLLGIYPCS